MKVILLQDVKALEKGDVNARVIYYARNAIFPEKIRLNKKFK